jgi:DNA-binding transcriptional MerR regulator
MDEVPPPPSGPWATYPEVLAHLRGDFPDLTYSKIRFLEDEGFYSPLRDAAGYRLLSEDDIARLRYVLEQQRAYHLPLSEIREQMSRPGWRPSTESDEDA